MFISYIICIVYVYACIFTLTCICIYIANGHNSDQRDGMKSNMQGIGGGSGDFGGGSGTIYTLYVIVLYVYVYNMHRIHICDVFICILCNSIQAALIPTTARRPRFPRRPLLPHLLEPRLQALPVLSKVCVCIYCIA